VWPAVTNQAVATNPTCRNARREIGPLRLTASAAARIGRAES
jgi:hypothetical protein